MPKSSGSIHGDIPRGYRDVGRWDGKMGCLGLAGGAATLLTAVFVWKNAGCLLILVLACLGIGYCAYSASNKTAPTTVSAPSTPAPASSSQTQAPATAPSTAPVPPVTPVPSGGGNANRGAGPYVPPVPEPPTNANRDDRDDGDDSYRPPAVPAWVAPMSVTTSALLDAAERRPNPGYPAEARQARISGVVEVRVTVDEDGEVEHAEVVSSKSPWLTAEAMQTVRRWRFRPFSYQGRPVKVVGIIPFNFKLDQ